MATPEARHGAVSKVTRAAEDHDARTAAGADRPPTAEEDAAAPTTVSAEVAEQYEEAMERGANAKGEGRIEG